MSSQATHFSSWKSSNVHAAFSPSAEKFDRTVRPRAFATSTHRRPCGWQFQVSRALGRDEVSGGTAYRHQPLTRLPREERDTKVRKDRASIPLCRDSRVEVVAIR